MTILVQLNQISAVANNCYLQWLMQTPVHTTPCPLPQGSVLGPLFLLFINDMPTILKDAVNINLKLYADDRSLTIYAYNNDLLTKYLQLYIDKLVGTYIGSISIN